MIDPYTYATTRIELALAHLISVAPAYVTDTEYGRRALAWRARADDGEYEYEAADPHAAAAEVARLRGDGTYRVELWEHAKPEMRPQHPYPRAWLLLVQHGHAKSLASGGRSL